MEWLVGGAFGLLLTAFFVSTIGLVIWTLVDVVRMPGDGSFKAGTQLVWVIVILLGGLIGAIIYLAVGRPPGGGNRCAATAPGGSAASSSAQWGAVALLR